MAALLVAGGNQRCSREDECRWAEYVDGFLVGGIVHPDQPWHLDHRDDRRGYLGVAHAHCNVVAGGKKGGARRQSRAW